MSMLRVGSVSDLISAESLSPSAVNMTRYHSHMAGYRVHAYRDFLPYLLSSAVATWPFTCTISCSFDKSRLGIELSSSHGTAGMWKKRSGKARQILDMELVFEDDYAYHWASLPIPW